jgi:hypothetical protein
MKSVTRRITARASKLPRTFWRGRFPHRFKSEMTVDDANCFDANLEYFDHLIENSSIDPATGQVSRCFVTVDRIGTAGDAGDVYGPGGDVDQQQDVCVTRPLIDPDDAGEPLSPTAPRPLPSARSREFPDKHVPLCRVLHS